MKTITQRVGSIPPDRRPRVYYTRGPRGLETGLGGSINVETIELVAQNVAGGTRGGLANVSIEQVLLWNPDVIITIDQDFAANVSNDSAWAHTRRRAARGSAPTCRASNRGVGVLKASSRSARIPPTVPATRPTG
jgi:ABC-type Fe3+-hydroxamate transport system substrate-binding protein